MLKLEEQNKLIEDNQGLVFKAVKGFYNSASGVEMDDLMGEGNLGLIKAGRTYDGDTAKFSTYATTVIKNQIIDYLRSLSNDTISLDQEYKNVGEDSDSPTNLYDMIESEEFLDPEQVLHNKELKMLLKKYLDKLTVLEAEILTRNFGLDDAEPESIRQIAENKGMSKSGIHAVYTRALIKLKTYFEES